MGIDVFDCFGNRKPKQRESSFGFPKACDFQNVERQEPTPVPESASLCQHLTRPYADTDRCSIPPESTRHASESPIEMGPIVTPPGGGGGGGGGLAVTGSQLYTFVLPTTDLSAGGFSVTLGSGSGEGGVGNQRQTLPFDGWFPIANNLWADIQGDVWARVDTGTSGTQNAGQSGTTLDITGEFVPQVNGNLLSITLKLQNVLSGAAGLIAVEVYEGSIPGGAHPGGGPSALPFVGASNPVDAGSIPDAVTDVTFSFP